MKILLFSVILAFSYPLAALPLSPRKVGYEATSSKVMIASQNSGATAAGLAMFEAGGNIVDAATAMTFVLAVERPQSTGIGGGGFTLLYLEKTKETIALDFREVAPRAAAEGMYLDKKGEVLSALSKDGILAGAVPGTVAGALTLHEKYGKLSRNIVMKPSIDLARQGLNVYPHLYASISDRADLLKKFPATREIFFDKNGEPLTVGSKLIQEDLAKTLETISAKGRDGFYKGEVAEKFLAEQVRLGGLISANDLASYQAKFRKPLKGSYKDFEILTMPLPSSGGIHLIEILNILEPKNLGKLKNDNPKAVHFTAAASQIAFADRTQYDGDSDFVDVPVAQLISKSYALKRLAEIPENKAVPSQKVLPGEFFKGSIKGKKAEKNHTTSFAIMDKAGNALVSIQSINGRMGSGVVVPGAGFLLNNEMDDFSAKPGNANLWGVKSNKQNAIAPGKRPLSSMTPTIVFKGGKPVLAIGTPAGSRIITCITEAVLNYIEYRLPLFDSIASTRYHHQWDPDILYHAPPYFPQSLDNEMQKMGYKTEKISDQGWICKVGAVAREARLLRGVCDTRDTGSCRGI